MISSLPYIIAFLAQCIGSWFADLLRSKRWLSTTKVRKLFDCSGSRMSHENQSDIILEYCTVSANFFNGLLLLLVTFVGCNNVVVIVFLCFAMGVGTLMTSGSLVNHLDIGPTYAGKAKTCTVGNKVIKIDSKSHFSQRFRHFDGHFKYTCQHSWFHYTYSCWKADSWGCKSFDYHMLIETKTENFL